MPHPAARGSCGGSVAPVSRSKQHPKTKHIVTNVLATVLCMVLSRVPVASAGIFPYDNMELQVSGTRGGIGGSASDKLDSCLLSYAPLLVFAVTRSRGLCGRGEPFAVAEFHHLYCAVAATYMACLAFPRNVEPTMEGARAAPDLTDASILECFELGQENTCRTLDHFFFTSRLSSVLAWHLFLVFSALSSA